MTIDRYLGAQLFVGTLLALAALLAILSLVEFMDEMRDVDEVYTLAGVARYVGLTTVGRVYELLPVAMLIGAMLSLGGLAAQSELIAFRAAGYSRKRIIFSVLGVGCAFAAFTAVIGETLLPASESAAARVSGDDERAGAFQKTGVGTWSREDTRFIHAREAGDDGEYLGVTIYEFDRRNRLQRVVAAASMKVGSERFALRNAREARLGEQRIEVAQLGDTELERAAVLEEGVLGAAAPNTMSTFELIRHIDFLKLSSLRRDFHELSLWSRLSQPLSVLVMLLLALPFVFSPVRGGAGQRLFYGMLIGLGYMLVTKIFDNAAIAFGFSPALGALAPPFLGFAVGTFRLARYR